MAIQARWTTVALFGNGILGTGGTGMCNWILRADLRERELDTFE